MIGMIFVIEIKTIHNLEPNILQLKDKFSYFFFQYIFHTKHNMVNNQPGVIFLRLQFNKLGFRFYFLFLNVLPMTLPWIDFTNIAWAKNMNTSYLFFIVFYFQLSFLVWILYTNKEYWKVGHYTTLWLWIKWYNSTIIKAFVVVELHTFYSLFYRHSYTVASRLS